jgi:hypothetical protein
MSKNLGVTSVIVSDFQAAFKQYGRHDEAKKLERIIAKIDKFDNSKLNSAIAKLGYDVNNDTMDRSVKALELVDSKLPFVIDVFRTSYDEINKNTKINFSFLNNYGEEIGIAVLVIVVISFFAILISFGGSIDSNGEVIAYSAHENADVDTTPRGVLSLKAKYGNIFNSEKDSVQLYIITDKPQSGLLKLELKSSGVIPFKMIPYKTVQEGGVCSQLIDLPIDTKTVSWGQQN